MKRALLFAWNAFLFIGNTIIQLILLIAMFPVIVIGEIVAACLYFSKEKRF